MITASPLKPRTLISAYKQMSTQALYHISARVISLDMMRQYRTNSFGEKNAFKETFEIEIYFPASYFGTLYVVGLSQVSRVGNYKNQHENMAK